MQVHIGSINSWDKKNVILTKNHVTFFSLLSHSQALPSLRFVRIITRDARKLKESRSMGTKAFSEELQNGGYSQL